MSRCFAVRCPRPPNQPWEPVHCPRFVRAPQPLKEFIYQAWALVPRDRSTASTADKVYNLCYAPGTGESGDQDFPIGGPSDLVAGSAVAYRWHNPAFRSDRDRNAATAERIYLNMQPDQVERMFNLLQTCANRFWLDAVVAIKRSTRTAATRRPDTIVVYVKDGGIDPVLNYLRNEMSQVARNQATPVIRSDWFKGDPPPGTRHVGMRGIGVADDPGGSQSFGAKLSGAVAEALDQTQRFNGRVGAVGRLQFACVALGMMEHHGMSATQPWKLP